MAGGDLVAACWRIPCRPYVPVNTGFGAFSMILPVLTLTVGMRGDWGPVQKEVPASTSGYWIYRCRALALGLSGM